jgi:hypothetical protein
MIQQIEISLTPKSRGFHLVTSEIMRQLPKLPKTGIIRSTSGRLLPTGRKNIFCKHTSCGPYTGRFGQTDDYRREELIRIIEHSVENLTLQELEALYYDMSTKNYIND